jgi:hypothetical protein
MRLKNGSERRNLGMEVVSHQNHGQARLRESHRALIQSHDPSKSHGSPGESELTGSMLKTLRETWLSFVEIWKPDVASELEELWTLSSGMVDIQALDLVGLVDCFEKWCRR